MNPLKKERIEQLNLRLTMQEFKSINAVSIRFMNSEESGEGMKGDLLVNGYGKGLYLIGFRERLELALFSNNNFKMTFLTSPMRGQNIMVIDGIDSSYIIEIFTTQVRFVDNLDIASLAN